MDRLVCTAIRRFGFKATFLKLENMKITLPIIQPLARELPILKHVHFALDTKIDFWLLGSLQLRTIHISWTNLSGNFFRYLPETVTALAVGGSGWPPSFPWWETNVSERILRYKFNADILEQRDLTEQQIQRDMADALSTYKVVAHCTSS